MNTATDKIKIILLYSPCFLFALMSPQEKRTRILNFVAFVTVSVIMVLTFSRGGLYFVAIIAATYMFFNRGSLGNYFKYLIMVPVVVVTFNFVVSETVFATLVSVCSNISSNILEIRILPLINFFYTKLNFL